MPRIQFDVNDRQVDLLNRLMDEARISSKKDLFNNAITLLEWAINEIKQGNKIASINEAEKKYRELQMPIFSNIAPERSSEATKSASA